MIQPLVSIIVPVYNVDQYLCKCIDSLINQTYRDIEIVLIDDGSKDSSCIICDEYARNDNRVIVIHKKNEGVAQARIDGFKISKGEFITFVDSDDYVDLHYVEAMLYKQKKYNADLVSCQYYVDTGNTVYPIKRTISGFYNRKGIDDIIGNHFLYDHRSKKAGITISLWTKLIKREFVLPALECGRGLKWSEDQLGVFSFLLNISTMYVMPDCLYYYVKHEGQVTRQYCFEFWRSQFESYCRYMEVDKKNLLGQQLNLRFWHYVVIKGIYNIMPKKVHSAYSFVREMRNVSKLPGYKLFFNSFSLEGRWLDVLKFNLLKHHWFFLFYALFYLRNIKH